VVSKRILLAVAKGAVARMLRVLEGHEVRVALTLSEAEQLLEECDFDMVIASVHFDESRMFNLIQAVRGHPRCAQVPVVGVLARKSRVRRHVSLPTLEHAALVLGARRFINVAAVPEDGAGNAEVRRMIDEVSAASEEP
jgi:hypothetical protein